MNHIILVYNTLPAKSSFTFQFYTTDFTDFNKTIKSYHINHQEHKSIINIVKTLKVSNKTKPMTLFK